VRCWAYAALLPDEAPVPDGFDGFDAFDSEEEEEEAEAEDEDDDADDADDDSVDAEAFEDDGVLLDEELRLSLR